MRRPEIIARQARCPSGWLGRLLVSIMARETASDNRAAVARLALEPTDHALEIGFGHGRTALHMASLASAGRVTAIDLSAAAVHRFARAQQHLIDAGRLVVQQADSRAMPFPDAHFDKVLAVHTIYFWSEPLADLREIARVSKPGGRLVLGYRSRADTRAVANLPAAVYRFYDNIDLRGLLQHAGFSSVETFVPSGECSITLAVALRNQA